jgi:ribonuclease Z
MMESYEWGTWPNFFPVDFHVIPSQEMTPVLECDDWHIYASPVKHMIPSIGFRIEFKQGGKVVAYSGDTSPCSEVIRLADQADILIHETSGNLNGHSSADQAGEIASAAKAKHLYLIHYDTRLTEPQSLIDKARSSFDATITLAEDLMQIDL